ncbi:hypothetical protein ACFL4Y_00780 [Gemmatimonadota bacterium]
METAMQRPHFFSLLALFTAASLFSSPVRLEAQQPDSPLLASFEQYRQMKETSEFHLEWIPLGPVMNSARVEAVQGIPGDPATIYVAFGSGNLWKTVDGGLRWRPIFENQSALGIGDIAVAPSDPDVIWLGSGESLKKARNFTMPGTGVFRSDDGGETWLNAGLHDSWHIGEIAVHPHDPDIVFAAVQGHFWSTNLNRGLYRTIDGGRTWEHVIAVNERVGANDVVIAPSDPDVIYVSTWENHPGIAGPGSGIWRSSDGGATFARLGGGLPDGEQTGRIGLAVSWTDPDKVYALVDNLNRTGQSEAKAEVYRSLDGGLSWERTHEEELQISASIGWYFCDCYVSPRDDDEVYVLGVRMARSSDGGRTFRLVGGDVYHLWPNPSDPLHLDQCELWIDPLDPNRLLLGNDGGFYSSLDRAGSWLHHNNIPAGEFYDISVDEQNPYLVYGGTQDDSSVFGPSLEWRPKYPDGWRYVWLDSWSGGDGCYTVPDPGDPNTVYFSSQNGGIRRKEMSADRSVSIRPRFPRGDERELRYNFVAPYIISPHNRLTLYHGGNYLFKSLDRGDNWIPISPDLSRSASPEKQGTAASAVAESRLRPGLLYVGTDRGAFWVTQNDGNDWIEYSEGLPDRYIRSISPSRFEASRVYISVTGINDDDLAAYLFASEDYGATWRSITGNLPDEVAYVILEDPVREDILYAGMYRGVYISVDRGRNWSLMGPGLPAVAVSDLVIQEREMDLLAGTHGRGIWRTNLRPIQAAFADGPPREDTLFPIPNARLPWINDTHRDPRYSTMESVPITFYLTRAASVTLDVHDERGEAIWSRSLDGRKGINQYRWDLVTERIDGQDAYFWRHSIFIPPGTYTVKVSGAGIDLSGELTVERRTEPPGLRRPGGRP